MELFSNRDTINYFKVEEVRQRFAASSIIVRGRDTNCIASGANYLILGGNQLDTSYQKVEAVFEQGTWT
jgi:hypothetical protein